MHLECIVGYIIEGAASDRSVKRLPQRRFNFIDGYIPNYYSILKLPERLEQISQADKVVSVLCDLEYDCMR